MEAVTRIEEVRTFETRGGNLRYVVRDEDGKEYTTFREAIGGRAAELQGRRARIEFHEQQRNGFTNVYLDRVEVLEEPDGADGQDVEEAAWKTAVDAAPWLLGDAPEGGIDPDEAFEKLQPFKERVAEDIRSDDDA